MKSSKRAGSRIADSSLLRHQRLSEVARALANALELEPFLQTVIAAASETTKSEAAFVVEADEQNQFLRFLAAPPGYAQAARGMRMELHDSAAGRAVKEQRAIRIPDGPTDLPHFSRADLNLASNTRSVLAVPVMAWGKALGALLAVNKDGTDYTEEDVTILETLAAPAALAMDNAALQRRLKAGFSELTDLDRLKSDFIAITSHELRTPLGVILGHASYLQEVLGEPYREQLDAIIRNASRLKEIVDSLASMDNYRTGGARLRQQAFSINDLIAQVVGEYADMASERGILLSAQPGSHDLLVEADPTKIAIALGNLVRNAIIFTDAGGQVLVNSESLPGYVRVSVTDNGIGIPMKDVPRVFERFFQVESHLTRQHSGMGLGLSVAKAMIELHGGRIWAESAEGSGSTFSFLLPTKSIKTGALEGT